MAMYRFETEAYIWFDVEADSVDEALEKARATHLVVEAHTMKDVFDPNIQGLIIGTERDQKCGTEIRESEYLADENHNEVYSYY